MNRRSTLIFFSERLRLMEAIKKMEEMHLGVALMKIKDEKVHVTHLEGRKIFCEQKWNHATIASFK